MRVRFPAVIILSMFVLVGTGCASANHTLPGATDSAETGGVLRIAQVTNVTPSDRLMVRLAHSGTILASLEPGQTARLEVTEDVLCSLPTRLDSAGLGACRIAYVTDDGS